MCETSNVTMSLYVLCPLSLCVLCVLVCVMSTVTVCVMCPCMCYAHCVVSLLLRVCCPLSPEEGRSILGAT